MTIEEFAQILVDENDLDEVYIAIIENGNWQLEVEISSGEIAGTYDTDTDDLEEARALADDLEEALYGGHGVVVHSTRQSWEEYLAGEEE